MFYLCFFIGICKYTYAIKNHILTFKNITHGRHYESGQTATLARPAHSGTAVHTVSVLRPLTDRLPGTGLHTIHPGATPIWWKSAPKRYWSFGETFWKVQAQSALSHIWMEVGALRLHMPPFKLLSILWMAGIAYSTLRSATGVGYADARQKCT